MTQTRKLVAILASDVVGYSRLAGADEDRILARLRALRSDLIDPTIAVHNGRVVKRTGDGSIVEFHSVVDAVRCAIELQSAMVERNAGVPEDRRIVFRIGIHLGDVVEEADGDLMGDGVNIAARLEGIAAPGSICLSEDAYRQVKARLDLAVTDLGPMQLKNIADPIRAYSLQVGPSATKAVPRPEPAAPTSVGKWSAVAALVLAVIVGAGWWGWNFRSVAISGPPTIAVLPLANMSGDPGLQYIADGTTENLIATLSRSPQIKVVARTSTDAYKGKSVDIRQIGKELGARYVLEGSVQKSADKLRIVAQLIDARNGAHVWAEHFDRQSSDPLALQDEVTDSIVKTLAGDAGIIKKKQYEDEWGKDTARLDEWDYYLRGHELYFKFNRDDLDKAVQIWEEGLRKYPNSALLKVKLGWASYLRWLNGWTADAEREGQTAIRYAQEALAANRASPLAVGVAHHLRGALYGDLGGDYERAVSELRLVLRLMPSDMAPKADFAFYLIAAGKPDEAIASLDWLGPEAARDQLGSLGFYYLGLAYFVKKDYAKAVESSRGLPPTQISVQGLAILAASYAQNGQIGMAKDTVKKLLESNPSYTIDVFKRGMIPDKEALGRLTDGLRQAGLPEI